MSEIKELPEGLYRRKDSPYIWGKFKVENMKKPYVFSTGTADAKLAKMDYDDKRNAAVKGKITGAKDKTTLRAMVMRALLHMRKNASYIRSALNVVDYLEDVRHIKLAKDVTPEDIEAYDLWRGTRAQLSTVNREVSFLQRCYNVSIKRLGVILDDPVKGFARHDEEEFARDRVLSYEERSRLFTDPKLDDYKKWFYMFALKTGMRQGEQRNAKWADINWAEGYLRVKTSKKKKRGAAKSSKAYRYIPLTVYPMQILKQLRADGGEKRSQFIFCDDDGKQLSRDGWIKTALEFACTRLKIEDFTYHDFRHTFATDFLRNNRDLKAFKSLSEIMGHSMERMTAKYSHLFPEDKNEQMAMLPAEPGFSMGSKVTWKLRTENGASVGQEKTAGNL